MGERKKSLRTSCGDGAAATALRSMSHKSIETVSCPHGIHFGEYPTPPVQVRESSNLRFGLLIVTTVAPGPIRPFNPTGTLPLAGDPYNSNKEGSLNPSPHVLRI